MSLITGFLLKPAVISSGVGIVTTISAFLYGYFKGKSSHNESDLRVEIKAAHEENNIAEEYNKKIIELRRKIDEELSNLPRDSNIIARLNKLFSKEVNQSKILNTW